MHKHLTVATPNSADRQPSPDELQTRLFESTTAFEEWVRASKGIARDGLQILRRAAMVLGTDRFDVRAISIGARDWFDLDKYKLFKRTHSEAVLEYIFRSALVGRRTRAFLLHSSQSTDEAVARLYDSRAIHQLEREITLFDRPGHYFDVYAVDYGAYISLAYPAGLRNSHANRTVSNSRLVPQDDKRLRELAIVDVRAIDPEPYCRNILRPAASPLLRSNKTGRREPGRPAIEILALAIANASPIDNP